MNYRQALDIVLLLERDFSHEILCDSSDIEYQFEEYELIEGCIPETPCDVLLYRHSYDGCHAIADSIDSFQPDAVFKRDSDYNDYVSLFVLEPTE